MLPSVILYVYLWLLVSSLLEVLCMVCHSISLAFGNITTTVKYHFGVKYHELAIFLDCLTDNLATREHNILLTVSELENRF